MSVAEDYVNRRYEGHSTQRWWAHSWVLVGGSINDAADYRHIVDAFNVKGVVSVESEHVDDGIVPADRLWHVPFPDNGADPGAEAWQRIAKAGEAAFNIERSASANPTSIYVHCQMGGSRSPAAAYMIMRAVLLMSHDGALAAIRHTRPQYGDGAYHQTYLNGARFALGEAP